MKKAFAILAFAVISASVFALDISVGARGNFNTGLGTDLTGDVKGLRDSFIEPLYRSLEDKHGLFGEGAGLYAQVNFYDFEI